MDTPEPLFTFRMQGDPRKYRRFYPGTAGGRPVLLVPSGCEVLCLRFHPDGRLDGVEVRACPSDDPAESPAQFEVRFLALVNGWQDELGLVSGPIHVRQFVLTDRGDVVGIARYGGWMLQAMEDPYTYPDPGERREMFELIAGWAAAGDFAFHVGPCDYFVTEDGRQVSS